MDSDRLLRWARSLGLFALARALTRGRLRILCYHGIWIGPPPHYGDCLFLSAQKFRQRMQLLAAGGYRVLALSQAVEMLAAGRVGSRDVVITIDDGWQGVADHMLPVLQRHRFPATLYVPTGNVASGEPVLPVLVSYLAAEASRRGSGATLQSLLPESPANASKDLADRLEGWLVAMPGWPERLLALRGLLPKVGIDIDALLATGAFSLMNPAALRRAHEAGIDIQLHTHNHTMHGMEPEHVGHEVELNRKVLAAMLQTEPGRLQQLCYPSGDFDRSVFPVLRKCQVVTATTTEFGLASRRDPLLALPRILDGELLSDIQFEARLCGFWSLARGLAALLGRRAPAAAAD